MSNLKELRTQNCLTQKELADKVGISVTTYNRIECGKQRPRPANKRRIALALKVEPQSIKWTREEHPNHSLIEPQKDNSLEEFFGLK